MDTDAGSAIERCLRERFPEARIAVTSGDGVHFRVEVVDEAFASLAPVARHRLVHRLLAPLLASGLLHAVEIRPRAPSETRP
jgi:acid stress-induced BolA-like protein IbaG/YrbA